MDHKGPLLVMLLYVALAMFAPRLSLADERQKDEMEAKAILMDILSSESPLASYEACKVNVQDTPDLFSCKDGRSRIDSAVYSQMRTMLRTAAGDFEELCKLDQALLKLSRTCRLERPGNILIFSDLEGVLANSWAQLDATDRSAELLRDAFRITYHSGFTSLLAESVLEQWAKLLLSEKKILEARHISALAVLMSKDEHRKNSHGYTAASHLIDALRLSAKIYREAGLMEDAIHAEAEAADLEIRYHCDGVC